jgi:Fic family protein
VPGLYRTAQEKRELESRNGAIQFLAVLHWIEEWKPGDCLTAGLIKELQRLAVNQIYTCAGHFRDGPVEIAGVRHQPPPWELVPALVDEMCEYVSQKWLDSSPIHLAAYVMWRINWIHPFFGGNGRTARAASYLILCARVGFRLPGPNTIPDQIVAAREPYFEALQDADERWETDLIIDVTKMESLLSSMLAAQLVSFHKLATGREE